MQEDNNLIPENEQERLDQIEAHEYADADDSDGEDLVATHQDIANKYLADNPDMMISILEDKIKEYNMKILHLQAIKVGLASKDTDFKAKPLNYMLLQLARVLYAISTLIKKDNYPVLEHMTKVEMMGKGILSDIKRAKTPASRSTALASGNEFVKLFCQEKKVVSSEGINYQKLLEANNKFSKEYLEQAFEDEHEGHTVHHDESCVANSSELSDNSLAPIVISEEHSGEVSNQKGSDERSEDKNEGNPSSTP